MNHVNGATKQVLSFNLNKMKGKCAFPGLKMVCSENINKSGFLWYTIGDSGSAKRLVRSPAFKYVMATKWPINIYRYEKM